jgi:cell wall-associated NlpC family hydrolase
MNANPVQRMRRRALAAGVAILLAAMTTPAALTTTAHADEIGDKKAEAQQIAGQIFDLNVKIEEYAEAANGAMVQLAQLVQQIAAAQARVDQAEAEQELHRRELQAYAVDAYVYGKPPEQVDVHVDPSGAVVDPRNSYLRAASVNRQQLIDSLRTAEANLKTQLAVLDQAKQAATKQAEDLKQRQDDALKAANDLQDVKSHIDGELATLVQQAQEAQAQAERDAAQRAAEQAASGSPNTDPSFGPSNSPSSSSDPADNPPVTIYIPTRPIPPGPAPDPDTEGAKKAIDFAKAQLGKPYVWGAAGPDAYDCSGLSMQAWKAGGVTMDHWTGSQYAQTRPIQLTEVQPGDLIFYNQMQHVALYLGDGKIIHAPHTGSTVQIEDMYYWRTTMAATRPGVGT